MLPCFQTDLLKVLHLLLCHMGYSHKTHQGNDSLRLYAQASHFSFWHRFATFTFEVRPHTFIFSFRHQQIFPLSLVSKMSLEQLLVEAYYFVMDFANLRLVYLFLVSLYLALK